MKVLSASVAAFAAAGFVLCGSAQACEWGKVATATPVAAPTVAEAPASVVDPVVLAQLEKGVALPASPKEGVSAN